MKSMSRELPAAEKPAIDPIALDLARTLPKIPIDDPRVELKSKGEWRYTEQFGNNFFYAWGTDDTDASQTIKETYVDPLHTWLGWPDFASENAVLIQGINIALAARAATKPLFLEGRRLLQAGADARRNGDPDLSDIYFELEDELEAAADHPLGTQAIDAYVWDQINPLLQEAAEKLTIAGFDPTQLYS